MSKKLFDDAIGEVPPSTVDVDATIARGRRAELVRRTANPVLATVAAVAVLLGGVAVAMLSDDDDAGYAPAVPPSTTKAPPPTASTSVSPCAGVAPTAPPQPERPAVTEDRLTDVLTELVSGMVRDGATLEQNPISKDRAGRQLGPLEAYHWYSKPKEVGDTGCQGGEDYYLAQASVRSPDGTGSVLVLVARAGAMGGTPDVIRCGGPVIADDQTSCDTETTPNGDKVLLTGLSATKGSVTNRVDVLRADQTFVVVESSNMGTSGKYPGPATASKIPLSHEQLKQIALDPDVTMYPR